MPLVLEEPKVIPVTLEEGVLKRTFPKTNIAEGLSQGARICLYSLKHDNHPQASVFAYPLTVILTPERIPSLDVGFCDVLPREIMREFKDFSVEDLNQYFLTAIKPLIPFMSHNYTFRGLQIKEQSFDSQLLGILYDNIRDL